MLTVNKNLCGVLLVALDHTNNLVFASQIATGERL
jgi:hypothetical protein